MNMFEILSPEGLERVYKHTEKWNKDNALHEPARAYQFLEDLVSHCNNDLTLTLKSVIGCDVFDQEEQDQQKHIVLQRSCFFAVVFMRYVQTQTGFPEELQQISQYDAEEGNQVNDYLAKFFNV